MNCRECEAMQERMKKTGEGITYLQAGDGNVLIVACDRHFNKLRQLVGFGVQEDTPVFREVKDIETEKPTGIYGAVVRLFREKYKREFSFDKCVIDSETKTVTFWSKEAWEKRNVMIRRMASIMDEDVSGGINERLQVILTTAQNCLKELVTASVPSDLVINTVIKDMERIEKNVERISKIVNE